MMLSDVYLSVANIGSKSRTERPRKTKIGTEVARVTGDSDTTFKVKGQRSPGRFTHSRVNASGSCSGEGGNVLAMGNYSLLRFILLGGACYFVCSGQWSQV